MQEAPRFHEAPSFKDKLKDLLATIEFSETTELSVARQAISDALQGGNSEVTQAVWLAYSEICEMITSGEADGSTTRQAELQIAIIVHKACIFQEVGNLGRYLEELQDAEMYAYNMGFDEASRQLQAEIEVVSSRL